jgi:MFS family permease
LGPLLGGFILDIASWRWIFLINLPIIVLCAAFGLPSISESHDQRKRRVDIRGALYAVIALSGITYGLIQGPAYHWQSSAVIALIIGIVFALVFLWAEDRGKDPMVDLSLFASRNFLGSNIMTFAMYGALSGYMFSLIIYLQTNLHYSSLDAGLSMLPVGVLMFLFAGRVSGLSAKFGPRLFMTYGPIISSLGMIFLYFLKPGQSYLTHVLPGVVLFGIGLVLMVAPLTTTVMTSVNESSSGIASGINNAISRVAGLIVIAMLGLLGAQEAYHFGLLVSAGLALSAGMISFTVIRNTVLRKSSA